MDLRPKPGGKGGTLRSSREGSWDALCGHGGPKFLCPQYRWRLPILILIFLRGLRLIRYSQGSWIKFIQTISSYSSNAESIFLNLFVNDSQVSLPHPDHRYTQTPLIFNNSLPSNALIFMGYLV